MIGLLLGMAAALGDEPLTLSSAIDRALEVHPSSAIAAARLDQARAARTGAITALGPQAAATASYTRRTAEVTTDFGGGDAVLQARHGLRAQASLTLPLIDPAAYAAIAAARTGLDAQELESDEIRRELAYLVADAYLFVLVEQALLDAAERRAAASAEVLEAAQARLEAGIATRNDVTRTELELASARLEVIRVSGRLASSRATLASLLVVDEVGALAEPVLGPPPEPTAPPDLLALELRAEQVRQEAGSILLEHLPVVGPFATASATNEAGFSGRYTDWTAGVSASWTLFDGGSRLASAAGTRAYAREIEAQTAELALEIERDREAARIALDTAEAGLEVARIQAAVAEQNAAEQRERFRHGLATALEVSDAAVAEFEAAAALAGQQLETQRALLALTEAMGHWPRETIR